jgi:hypothetical protein
MTPQQERIKQAESHEAEAYIWHRVSKLSVHRDGAQRYAKYCKRTARQNRRAFKRESH